MNQEPLAIARFVALVSPKAVGIDTVKAWFACVKGSAPTGTMLSIPSTDDKGLPRTVALVHRETKGRDLYLIPLTRDLAEAEAGDIVKAFSAVAPEGEFEIETSASHLSQQEAPETDVVFDEDKYLALCMAWAKRQHETWMQDRIEQGWRYGTEMSMSEKTNPLLRPFDQLPDQYRKPNLEEPQALLDLLNDQGYAVITHSELAAMLKLMRQSATSPAEPIAEAEEIDEDMLAARMARALQPKKPMSDDERDAQDKWTGQGHYSRVPGKAAQPVAPAPAPTAPKSFGRRTA